LLSPDCVVRWHGARKLIYNAFPYQGALRQDIDLARLDTVNMQLRSRYFFSVFYERRA
jgi:hypothetical protein